jgi:hypothetical protein
MRGLVHNLSLEEAGAKPGHSDLLLELICELLFNVLLDFALNRMSELDLHYVLDATLLEPSHEHLVLKFMLLQLLKLITHLL